MKYGMVIRPVIAAFWGTLILAAPAAMDWPSAAGVMTGSFGQNNDGMPLLGVEFEGEGPITAADRGELLYVHREGNCASRLPSPLGAWAALDHGDGIISVYSRLEEDRNRDLPAQAEKGGLLGMPGVSAATGAKKSYFFLFDRRERRWINPSMIIVPFQDTRPPVIARVGLRNEEGVIIDPARTRTITQGRYFISVEAADTLVSAGETPLAPFRIVCSVNGREAGVLGFETYSARDGVLMVYRNGLVPVRDVFAPKPGWEIGEAWFTRGQATLEIIAQDIAGNERNLVYRLQVE
jgi:hypothetical protein